MSEREIDLTDAGLREQTASLHSGCPHVLELLTRIRDAARAEGTEVAYTECGTCGGVPPCSGLPCVCGGANTIYAERDGLRLEVYDRDARLARVVDAARALEDKLQAIPLLMWEEERRTLRAALADAGAGKGEVNEIP